MNLSNAVFKKKAFGWQTICFFPSEKLWKMSYAKILPQRTGMYPDELIWINVHAF